MTKLKIYYLLSTIQKLKYTHVNLYELKKTSNENTWIFKKKFIISYLGHIYFIFR